MKNNMSVGKKIASELRSRISKMSEGQKLRSENDLCAEFSVSRATVNKIINALVTEGLLYRIQGSGTFVRRPCARKRPIRFLLPCPDFFMYDCTYSLQLLLSGVMRGASRAGLEVVGLPVSKTNNPSNIDWGALNDLDEETPVVVLGFWFEKVLPFLRERKCRTVFLDHHGEKGKKYPAFFKDWTLAWLDCRSMTARAVARMFEEGARNMAFVHSNYHQDAPCNTGWRDGLKKCGAPLVQENLLFTGNDDQMCDRLSGGGGKFDGVIIDDPAPARRTIGLLREGGMRIPDDVRVLCLGEHKRLAQLDPPVAAVAWPFARIGEDMAGWLAGEKLGGMVEYEGEIVERESLRKGAGAGAAPPGMGAGELELGLTF